MVNNERTVQTRKSSSEQQQQNAGRIPSRPKCVCKFADWFNHCKCTALHSAIWLTVLALKQIRKSRCSQTKKLYVAIQIQAFWRKPKVLTRFITSKCKTQNGKNKACSVKV